MFKSRLWARKYVLTNNKTRWQLAATPPTIGRGCDRCAPFRPLFRLPLIGQEQPEEKITGQRRTHTQGLSRTVLDTQYSAVTHRQPPPGSRSCSSLSTLLLRLHLEQTGRPPDAALREGLHRDEGAGRSSWGRRPLQIPLREAEDVGRRRNTKPVPGLRGSRGGNGETHVLSWSQKTNEWEWMSSRLCRSQLFLITAVVIRGRQAVEFLPASASCLISVSVNRDIYCIRAFIQGETTWKQKKKCVEKWNRHEPFIFMMCFNFIYDVNAGCNYTDGHTLKQNTSP